LREAVAEDNGPLGGEGLAVEVDETYFGKNQLGKHKKHPRETMNRIVSLVDRSTGRAISVVFNEAFNSASISKLLYTRIARNSILITDEAPFYKRPGLQFAKHKTVNHAAKEYARGDVTTNTVEGFFGIFKRGMKGIYQHCGQQHLHRYLAEFDFRYSNRSALGIDDTERADIALKNIAGKRLYYRRPSEAVFA
jgi:hypothetical protein